MKFKCLLSGTEVEFIHEVDIQAMLNHPQYEEVKEKEETLVPKAVTVKTKVKSNGSK